MKGRKGKLTEEVSDDFCAAIAIGCTYAAAAANAEITYTTFRNWQIEGEKAAAKLEAGEKLTTRERRYLDFFEAVEEAKGQALLAWQGQIDRAAKTDPQWAWRMLQVRAPNDYAPPAVRQEIAGKDGGALAAEIVIRYADDAGDRNPTAA